MTGRGPERHVDAAVEVIDRVLDVGNQHTTEWSMPLDDPVFDWPPVLAATRRILDTFGSLREALVIEPGVRMADAIQQIVDAAKALPPPSVPAKRAHRARYGR